MSTLAGRRVTDLEAHIPPAGGFLATGHLDSGPPLASGFATLTVGDLALVGTVLPNRGGLDSPERPSFVLRGGAGWATLLPAASWASPSKVRLSTVLSALGQATGEAYDAPPEALLGSAYGWDAGTPADAVLADLVARGATPTWRVAPFVAGSTTLTGRTRFDAWPSLPAADAKGTVMDPRLIRGAREVGLTTNVFAFLPGATLKGATVARLTLREQNEELRAVVYDASDLGPLSRWRRICLKVLPWLARLGIDPATGNLYVRAADGRIDLAGGGPAVLRVPDVARLVFDPGIPGSVAPGLAITRDGGQTFVTVALVTTPGCMVGGTVAPTSAQAPTTTPLAPSGSKAVTCG